MIRNLLSFFLLLTAFCGYAQNKSIGELPPPKPKAILLMLHLSTNKIEALHKRHMESEIPEVIEGDEETNKAIMKDFAARFTFCPVYFFYDTCYELAKQKRWTEIVFYDYESLTMKKKIGTNSFADYWFAEVGYPTPGDQLPPDSTVSEAMMDRTRGDEDAVSTRRNGVNLYNENFKPLNGKLRFTEVTMRRKGPIMGEKKMIFDGGERLQFKLNQLYQ